MPALFTPLGPALLPRRTGPRSGTCASLFRSVARDRGPLAATLQDATGTVKLSLWGAQIAKVRPGQRVKLAGAWVREYRGHLQVSLGRDASMAVLVP